LSDVVRAPAVLPAFHPLASEVTYVATPTRIVCGEDAGVAFVE
jgi:hypothetical protein